MVTKNGVKERRLGYINTTRNSGFHCREDPRGAILYHGDVWEDWRVHWVSILITVVTVYIDVKASHLSNSIHEKAVRHRQELAIAQEMSVGIGVSSLLAQRTHLDRSRFG